ncbi:MULTISPECIES: pyridoxamine 5'-phosphate oxidase family protein [Microbacterium]|uniref:pyridoxamine 5'-phosphate oxidase family protein n=1 Tax=Microbacterium TaxID=33882 RepID=UPI0006895D44|nr:pyridoxamine 5'-phosphate oxidase family protein [Microbacterium profundi]MCE7481276.1 pyridoxamine 5'-phosphate oxidase family protein [Microbacterium profundi]
MISELQEQQCRELLTTTTVGRIGFVADERVHIFPVNYAVSGDDVLVHTSSDGILRRVGDADSPVAFEIDYHDDLAGTGWSVLMHGRISTASDEDVPTTAGRAPWAGAERVLPLRFHIESISGRRVRRERH